MKPEDLAKSGTERGHQRAVFCWAALNASKWPELALLFAIKNEEKGGLIRGSIAKADGVRKGVSDTFLSVARRGYHGCYIEMKKPGEEATKEQLAFGKAVTEEGYFFKVCDHWEKATQVLEWYLS